MDHPYEATDHVRQHLVEAADEGALFIRKLLRGEVQLNKDNLSLATQARVALGAFTRYEATLSAREQNSVILSRFLAGDNRDEFERYVSASLPDHPAVRTIIPALAAGSE